MAYIAVFIPGAPEAHRHDLRESNILGRASGVDVCINEPNISRRHCRIERVGERWMLCDLGSTNGTWLDAARVRRYALRDGETFYIGDARIVFHADQRIEYRPADPNEALSVAKIFHAIECAAALADTAVTDRAPNRPLPRAGATVATRGQFRPKASAKSLAFQRPPAMPLVHCATTGNWLHVMLKSICG